MASWLQGHFLVAAPTLVDPGFAHTVVLLIQHDEQGALGLVINRPLQVRVSETWSQISDLPYENTEPLYYGGPCQSPLMVLHRCEPAGRIEVLPGVYFTTDADDLKTLIEVGAQPLKFFAGSAGWAKDQLESEINHGDWLVMPAKADHVFMSGTGQWRDLTRLIGRLTAAPDINPKLIPPEPWVN